MSSGVEDFESSILSTVQENSFNSSAVQTGLLNQEELNILAETVKNLSFFDSFILIYFTRKVWLHF